MCRLSEGRKAVEPCSIVIFGASGDLTARKLIPALYHLFKEKQMPPAFRIIGFARREKTDASWRSELRAALDQFSRTKPVDDEVWQEFAQHIFYCQGDLDDAAAYEKLEKQLASVRQRAAAAEPALLSGHLAQPVRRGGRAAASRRAAAEGRRSTAGSGWSSRSRSATTWPRPGS